MSAAITSQRWILVVTRFPLKDGPRDLAPTESFSRVEPAIALIERKICDGRFRGVLRSRTNVSAIEGVLVERGLALRFTEWPSGCVEPLPPDVILQYDLAGLSSTGFSGFAVRNGKRAFLVTAIAQQDDTTSLAEVIKKMGALPPSPQQ